MELLKVIIHLAWRRQFFITNVYLPPHRSGYPPPLKLTAWASRLKATSTSKPEKAQFEAARVITGLVHSTPVEAVLAVSQLPPISMRFQTISALKVDECACHSPADDRHQTLFSACRQRMKRNDWRNTKFICQNHHGLNPQVLTQTPHSYEQLSIASWHKLPPIQTFITPVDKRMSPSQQRDLSLQTFASIPPADFQIFTGGSFREGIEDSGPVWYSSAKITASMSDMLPRAHIVAPS